MAEVFCSGGAMRGGELDVDAAQHAFRRWWAALPAEHRAAIPSEARNELE